MGFNFDSQTQVIVFIIIAFAIFQFFYSRYAINKAIEDNNKKLTETFTKQIDKTFKRYMSSKKSPEPKVRETEENNDSIDDPADKQTDDV